ncbi:uncharacterized protein LOC110318551 [Mus pahari]|uniref:uncharacterized protein LOC110318551 n=1 Tax=Mus pahari TaxID=10093 RepID=UPI000A31065F|nr:uncharacterized protein LOC110318551 [Mus pahari]
MLPPQQPAVCRLDHEVVSRSRLRKNLTVCRPLSGPVPAWLRRFPRSWLAGVAQSGVQKAKCLFNFPGCGLVISTVLEQLMVHEVRAKVSRSKLNKQMQVPFWTLRCAA